MLEILLLGIYSVPTDCAESCRIGICFCRQMFACYRYELPHEK